MNESKIREHLRICYDWATFSPDPSNQNAAMILDPTGNEIAVACNEFPYGIVVTPEHLTNRDKKLFYIEHAERGAVYKAAREYGQTRGLTMVCPWFACSDCARAIILSGIKHVIGHKQRMAMTPERWKANVDESLVMLKDCGVTTEFYDGVLGCNPIIVNGQSWQP